MKYQIQEAVHHPTPKTVLAIEDAIRKANLAVSRNKILEKLPTKVMRSTLNVALDYLERRGLVLETKHGFIWTHNTNPKLAAAEAAGLKQ